MTLAHLRKKVPALAEGTRWHDLEDPLTSDVLGPFRFLPYHLGIGRILLQAQDEQRKSIASWLHASPARSRLLLWPTLEDRKEPDALLCVWDGVKREPRWGVVIEVKLRSPQHPIERPDGRLISQIAHYLVENWFWRWRHQSDPILRPEHRGLVFLTAHRVCPIDEMHQARLEASEILGVAGEDLPLFWLAWRSVAHEVRKCWLENECHAGDSPWLLQLPEIIEELKQRGLGPRELFTPLHLDLRGKPISTNLLPQPPYASRSVLPCGDVLVLPPPPYSE